jgi:hypothetical protein
VVQLLLEKRADLGELQELGRSDGIIMGRAEWARGSGAAADREAGPTST